jgi:5-(carboxyamino)imidazole ribonucleotide mutase
VYAQAAAEELERFGIEYELSIVSAHRTPQKMYDYAHSAPDRGLKVLNGQEELLGTLHAKCCASSLGMPCVYLVKPSLVFNHLYFH